jgi:hypothetical protein
VPKSISSLCWAEAEEMKTIVRMIIAVSLDMRHIAKFQLIID